MLESLKHAEQSHDEYQRRAIKARQDAEETVRADIGLECAVSVHVGKLYGSVGSLHCKRPQYTSIDKLPAPSATDIENLVRYFPPVSIVISKAACTSIRPAEYQDKGDRESDTVTPIAPMVLKLKPGQWQSISLEWYGRHEANGAAEVWRVSVELPYSLVYRGKLGRLELRVKTDRYGGRHVEHCDFQPVAPFARIRWASGGSQYENEFTIHAPETTDVWSIVKTAMAEVEPKPE